MRVLIHVCCAPCLGGPLEALRAEGHEVEGLFYNPNIHPLLEFRRRIKGLRVFLESDGLPVEVDDRYGLEEFLRQADPLRPGRCARCYALRLNHVAQAAARRGLSAFTTTLLVSRQQDHEAVCRAGQEAAERTGVAFLDRDFRCLADRSDEIARRRRLYRQGYCGCVFSESERYRDTDREAYRGPQRGGGVT
jgi:predicted adenine nucleotide alpha hydrolase (AANH) superfamily ATPase